MGKKFLIFILLVVLICSLILPAAAETCETSEYVVTPWLENPAATHALPVVGTVVDGQSVDHSYWVNPGSTVLEISVTWIPFPFPNEIELRILSPDGSTIGTYGDMYDGQANGKIPVRISSPSLMSGNWFITIYGKTISGIQSYTLTINEM